MQSLLMLVWFFIQIHAPKYSVSQLFFAAGPSTSFAFIHSHVILLLGNMTTTHGDPSLSNPCAGRGGSHHPETSHCYYLHHRSRGSGSTFFWSSIAGIFRTGARFLKGSRARGTPIHGGRLVAHAEATLGPVAALSEFGPIAPSTVHDILLGSQTIIV